MYLMIILKYFYQKDVADNITLNIIEITTHACEVQVSPDQHEITLCSNIKPSLVSGLVCID